MMEDAILKLAAAIELLATSLESHQSLQSTKPNEKPGTLSLPIVSEEDIKTLATAEPKEEKRKSRSPKDRSQEPEEKPAKYATYDEAVQVLLKLGANAETQEEKEAAKRNRKRIFQHFKPDAEKLPHLSDLGPDIWSRVIDYVQGGGGEVEDDV